MNNNMKINEIIDSEKHMTREQSEFIINRAKIHAIKKELSDNDSTVLAAIEFLDKHKKRRRIELRDCGTYLKYVTRNLDSKDKIDKKYGEWIISAMINVESFNGKVYMGNSINIKWPKDIDLYPYRITLDMFSDMEDEWFTEYSEIYNKWLMKTVNLPEFPKFKKDNFCKLAISNATKKQAKKTTAECKDKEKI